jgi:hypothetical protein
LREFKGDRVSKKPAGSRNKTEIQRNFSMLIEDLELD